MRFLTTLRKFKPVHSAARRLMMALRRRYFGLQNVHPTFYMARGCRVSKDLVAHEYSFINIGCILDVHVELGRYAMLAPHVAIIGGDHIYNKPGVPIIFTGRPGRPPVTKIGDDAWIGFGVIIFAGVNIGRGAIVGAGSVVTKDIPPYEIHAGIPSRKIGERFSNPNEREIHENMLLEPVVNGDFCPPLTS